MSDERPLIAHVLRRTGFGPFPGQVERLVPRGVAGVIDDLVNADALPVGAAPSFRDTDDGPVRWWIARMADERAGLAEKLTWFLHGHITTGYDKVGDWSMVWDQHLLVRAHALASFRDLLQRVTVDPAMLVYLDGDGSSADAPNENFSRELMELFLLGRGSYTQDDVRAGARALAGWSVDGASKRAAFDETNGLGTPVTYLGRPVQGAAGVIDAACDHPACAPFVAGRLYRFLVGVEPDQTRRGELVALFRDSGLELRPLTEAILRGPEFLERRLNRPRYPVEWVTGAVAALNLAGNDFKDAAYDALYSLGQLPFFPPNVAGWPPGPRWVAAGTATVRAGLALQTPSNPTVRDATDPVSTALDWCSLYEVTDTTRAALDAAARQVTDPEARASVLLGLCVTSPEFALA